MAAMSDVTPPSTEPIVCPLFPWYSRLNHRFSGLSAMFLIFGLWFYIDGTWRWPKENIQAEARETFLKEVDTAKANGTIDAWLTKAKAEGLQVPPSLDIKASNAADVLWAMHSAKRGWPEKPKRHTEEELAQQAQLALFMFAALAALLLYVFLVRHRRLIGHDDHFITPSGKRVNFADAFRLDTRKWDKQGLAYVTYRDGSTERCAIIDDLQYDGAGKVLERLKAHFHGELIEKVTGSEDDDAPQKSGPDTAS